MAIPIKKSTVKSGALHARNPHSGRYDFDALCGSCAALKSFLKPNPAGDQTVDFSDANAVLCLNQALLAHYYGVKQWMIPEGYLCPPIPGRVDYIHYLADLLSAGNKDEVPTGKRVRVLDVGTGANCIYPIIGSQSYGWKFVATDIDPVSVKTARAIVAANSCLTNLVKVVQQKDSTAILKGIIRKGDYYDLTMCNPPFHASAEDAQAGSQRKVKKLGKGRALNGPVKLNFGGQNAELWCDGGEVGFVTRMATESVEFADQVGWFTSLISKSESLQPIKRVLAQIDVKKIEVINMSQGQKVSRLIAWRFQD
jgi:23S rRNA (adenine1618-N6)-methyltransferase